MGLQERVCVKCNKSDVDPTDWARTMLPTKWFCCGDCLTEVQKMAATGKEPYEFSKSWMGFFELANRTKMTQ